MRMPGDLQERLQWVRDELSKKAGGVPQDFSKVVRHILNLGLERIERDLGKA